MSIDFGVWHSGKRLTKDEAVATFVELIEGKGTPSPHSGVDAFFDELLKHHPEGDSAWSSPIEKFPGHLLMTVVGSHAEKMEVLLTSLAAKYGLVLIDSETEEVRHPEDFIPSKPWWKFW